jgi:hypothetical protein
MVEGGRRKAESGRRKVGKRTPFLAGASGFLTALADTVE